MRYIGILMLGMVIGQRVMMYAYNPDNLEAQALNFSAASFFNACNLYSIHPLADRRSFCQEQAELYQKDVKDIWHNKAWEKF